MIEISLNQNNPAFIVKDQVATTIIIRKIISKKLIERPASFHLNMLDQKDITIWSRSFSEFSELSTGREWAVDKEFQFYDHITFSITETEKNVDFDMEIIIEKY